MKVAVVGTGYVGLVSGVCLAAAGHEVTCVDLRSEVIESLNQGLPHIYERGLPELLESVVKTGAFRATTDLEAALEGARLALIAVGTPSEGGVIDLTAVRAAARQIGAFIGRSGQFLAVIVKSTVIPGTTVDVVRAEIEAASGKRHPSFGLGMNPEFLREGEAIEDFAAPDRIVLGYEDEATRELLEELYAPWDVEKVRVGTKTAEMIKYANNALLATQISAVNEIANLAAALGGIDIMDVVKGVTLDHRWSPILEDGTRVNPQILSYLVPGCGFGGSCFPKDVQALRSQGESLGLPMRMLNAVLAVNDAQPEQVVNILAHDLLVVGGAKVLVLGLAFKPGTDDVRESPALKIVQGLLGLQASLTLHDPVAGENFTAAIGDLAQLRLVDKWQDEVAGADVIIVITRWPEYIALADMDVTGKVVIDARRMLPAERLTGARYRAIGLRMDDRP